MAKLEITLSRAHKIAERLKAKSTELASEASRAALHATVTGTAGEAMLARLGSQAGKAILLASESEKFSRACSDVRAAIGRENEKRGINTLLAKSSAVNSALATHKTLCEQAKEASMSLSELSEYKPLSDDSYGMGRVSVNVFNAEQITSLEEKVTLLQREAFALADQVAEANAARFAMDIDDAMAALVTGA